jgi:plastocyanin
VKKKKYIPTKHVFKVGDVVTFKFAGSWHKGKVIELTQENNGHATYTATTSANGRIYPCLGLNGSNDTGWIHKE